MSTFSKIYAVHHANKRSRLSDVMLFTLGLISFFRIELIGQIYLVEIVASVLLLIVLWVRRFELTIPITHRILLILGFFWLCGAILTDIYRSTPWEDLARGWASIIFLLLLIVFLYQLILVDTVKVYIIILGYGIGQAFGIILQPSELAEIDPWKFGLGSAITVLLVAWIGLYYLRYNQISRL